MFLRYLVCPKCQSLNVRIVGSNSRCKMDLGHKVDGIFVTVGAFNFVTKETLRSCYKCLRCGYVFE